MKNVFIIIILFGFIHCQGQQAEVASRCLDPKFEKTVIGYLDFTVPTITVDELVKTDSTFTFLDARESEEYQTSHLNGAINVGFDEFDITTIDSLDRDLPIVVYCSIGYRSEKIAEKLIDAGFTDVRNLFGSIFEWVNQGNKVVDSLGNDTSEIHTYNKKWSKWMSNPAFQKIY